MYFYKLLPKKIYTVAHSFIYIIYVRMKGNANPTTTPLKVEPEFNDPIDESLQLTIADKTVRPSIQS